jgi:hypothetical protein
MSRKSINQLVPYAVGVAVLVVGSSAVSAGSTLASTPSESGGGTSMPESGASEGCPSPHGGDCLGELGAGTYSTSVFAPSITYTVPDGWTNLEDLPGNFLLVRLADPVVDPQFELQNFFGIYRDVLAPMQTCDEGADPSVGMSAREFTAWLAGLPELVSTDPEPVSVGGLDGYVVDVTSGEMDTWCPELPPIVPVLVGGGVSSLHHVVFEGATERIYVLDYEDGNVVIEVGQVPGETSFEEYVEAVQPIIDSLWFGDGAAESSTSVP